MLLAELENSIAEEIASSYMESKKMIEDEMNQIEEKIKEIKIMSPYLLFGILKQTS